MITKEISNHISKLINSETKRLTEIAEKDHQQDQHGLYPDEIQGYIVGVAQAAGNIDILVKDQIDYTGKTCWRCGVILETKNGKDYAGEAVKVCSNCEAVIRD